MGILSSVTTLFSGGTSVLYKWGAIAGGILIVAVGSYFYGNHVGSMKSKVEIANYVDQRDKALIAIQALQGKTNVRVITKYVTRTQVIHDNQQHIQDDIKNVPDINTVLSAGWLHVYNGSISELSGTTGTASDPTPAIKATDALSGIAVNNATCLEYKARAEALIEYELQTQANMKAVAGKKGKNK